MALSPEAATIAFAPAGGERASPLPKDATRAANPVAGTYQLMTVDGGALPAHWAQSGQDQEVQIVAGSFPLNSNGSFTGTREFRIIGPGAPSGHAFDQWHGAFTTVGNQVTMTFRGETEQVTLNATAALVDQALTVMLDDRSHVYHR
jgi:hypothetical protein